MRKCRDFIHMVFTAVICLAMSLVPGRSLKAALEEGQAVSAYMCGLCGYGVVSCSEAVGRVKNALAAVLSDNASYRKKVFFWLTGPGDRMRASAGGLYQWKAVSAVP